MISKTVQEAPHNATQFRWRTHEMHPISLIYALGAANTSVLRPLPAGWPSVTSDQHFALRGRRAGESTSSNAVAAAHVLQAQAHARCCKESLCPTHLARFTEQRLMPCRRQCQQTARTATVSSLLGYTGSTSNDKAPWVTIAASRTRSVGGPLTVHTHVQPPISRCEHRALHELVHAVTLKPQSVSGYNKEFPRGGLTKFCGFGHGP